MRNVCIIGCGAISPVHIEAVNNCKSARLYGVCDIDKTKRDMANELGVRFFASFDDVLNDKNVDSVHICTPHYLHFDMIKKALRYGKSVVCEKPCVITKSEFEQLKRTDGIENVCFVMQNRLNLSIIELKNLIENETLGKIMGIRAVLAWHRTKEYYNAAKWRGTWNEEGGGVLINQAIHTLDLMSYLVGDIVSVKADMANYSLADCIEVEDTLMSYLDFKNGVKGIFFATNANAQNDDVEISVYFEKGTAKYIFNKLFVNGIEQCENEKTSIGKAYWGSGHERLISNFYDKNKYFDIQSIENTMYAVFETYESAKKSGKITV